MSTKLMYEETDSQKIVSLWNEKEMQNWFSLYCPLDIKDYTFIPNGATFLKMTEEDWKKNPLITFGVRKYLVSAAKKLVQGINIIAIVSIVDEHFETLPVYGSKVIIGKTLGKSIFSLMETFERLIENQVNIIILPFNLKLQPIEKYELQRFIKSYPSVDFKLWENSSKSFIELTNETLKTIDSRIVPLKKPSLVVENSKDTESRDTIFGQFLGDEKVHFREYDVVLNFI